MYANITKLYPIPDLVNYNLSSLQFVKLNVYLVHHQLCSICRKMVDQMQTNKRKLKGLKKQKQRNLM